MSSTTHNSQQPYHTGDGTDANQKEYWLLEAPVGALLFTDKVMNHDPPVNIVMHVT